MKNTRKIVAVILAFLLAFSAVGSSFALSDEVKAQEIQTAVDGADAEKENSLAAVFEQLIAKIKRVILIIVGNISIILDGNYSKTDVAEYSSNAFAVPGLDDGFIPQGICYVEKLDAFALSGYIKGDNSRIYLVENGSDEAKELILKDFTKHAGGIASDGDDIWVCAGGNESEGGFIYHLSASFLDRASDGEEIEFDGSFQTQVRASALCCDGEMLYVAEFYEEDDYPVNPSHSFEENNAWAVGYKLPVEAGEYDGTEKAPDVIISIPEKVQGMSVTDEGNVLFSTSYGRFYDSTLHVYEPFESWNQSEFDFDGTVVPFYAASDESLVSKVKMPTLMEGIDVEGSDLYAVFESGAGAYSDAKEVITDVRRVEIAQLIAQL